MISKVRLSQGVMVFVSICCLQCLQKPERADLQLSTFGAKCDGSSDDTAALNCGVSRPPARKGPLGYQLGYLLTKASGHRGAGHNSRL